MRPPSQDSQAQSRPEEGGAAPEGAIAPAGSGKRSLIAPWWHTTLMVGLIAGLSFLSARHLGRVRQRQIDLIPNYAVTIAYEWILAGLVLWGIRRRGVSRSRLIGLVRPGWRGWWADFAVAIVFWLIAITVLAIFAQFLARLPGSHFDPGKIAGVTRKLAPTTGGEIALFLVLSVSAGFCEELVFRGYFQQQFTSAGRHVLVGTLASAILFGCAHGYEGIPGIVLITAYGAMFSVLTLVRRGLRAGMIAHAWHDGLSGLALAFLHHYGSHFGLK